MNQIAKDIIEGLTQFVSDLRDGKPIPVTTVRRYETPDGPMHTFTKGELTTEAQSEDQ